MATLRKFWVAPLIFGLSVAAFISAGPNGLAQEACSVGLRAVQQLTHRVHHSAATLHAWKQWREAHPNWKPRPQHVVLPKSFFQTDCNPIELAPAAPLTALVADDVAPSSSDETLFASVAPEISVTGPKVQAPVRSTNSPSTDAKEPDPSAGFGLGYSGFYGGGIPYYGGRPVTPPMTPIAPTPEPSSLLLLGSGLCFIGRYLRRRNGTQ